MSSRFASKAPTVSAILVGWNSRHYLEGCLRSLVAQTLPLAEIVLVDNGSSDGTAAWLREHHPEIRCVVNSENVGFCVANNQGIAASNGQYVLLVNTDVVLRPRFVEIIVEELEREPGLGWGSGKLRRLIPEQDPDDVEEHVIDSAGEVIMKSRRAINRGNEAVDRGQYDRREEIFGVTAAAAVYRREMLDDIRLGPDWFDTDYFAYLEDCDLNWRAQLRGWRCIYAPQAVGYHARQHPTGRDVSIRRRAFFNRYLNLVKNATGVNLLLALPHIAIYDGFRVVKTLLREPDVLGGALAMLALLPGALAKRRIIQSRRTVSSAVMRRWMVPEGYLRHVVKRCCRARTAARKATSSEAADIRERVSVE